MFLSRLKDPTYCVAQAENARTHAAFCQDRRTKAALLKIADGYLRIAEEDEKHRTRGHRPAKPVPYAL